MSKMPSSTPPTPLPAGGSETTRANRFPPSAGDPLRELAPALAEASNLVASYGAFGLVWLNRDLMATRRYGRLVDFVQLDAPITNSVLALIGLEDEIRALPETKGRILELPAVGVATPDGDTHRLNFSIFWQPGQGAFLVLIYRVASQTELEVELSRQIRARLMAEAAVTAKSKELTRANADLESFAAIITHDLKAPMRHMRRLAEGLGVQAGAAGNEALQANLKEIEVQAQRMSHMLTALLDYSTLGRKYEAIETIDTRKLIGSIVQSLPKSEIAITISGSWPKVTTLAAPLDLVLRNLIDNALKHHDRGAGAIAVSCADGDSALTISVSDDGPGIAPKYHDTAFLPFRTLASSASQRGTGMGLAMVRKMVEAAGGTIMLSSDPSHRRGTVFTVFWPKNIVI